jgi:hypothetical protein
MVQARYVLGRLCTVMSTLEPRDEGFKKGGNLSVGRPPAAGLLQVLTVHCMADCWYRECTGYFYGANPVIGWRPWSTGRSLWGIFGRCGARLVPRPDPGMLDLGAQQTLPPWVRTKPCRLGCAPNPAPLGYASNPAALGAQQTLPPWVRNKPCHTQAVGMYRGLGLR